MTVAARRVKPEQHRAEIDERFITEWVAWGFKELRAYLQKHAAFDQYLRDKEKQQ